MMLLSYIVGRGKQVYSQVIKYTIKNVKSKIKLYYFITEKTKLIFGDLNGIQALIRTTINLVYVEDKLEITKAIIEFIKRGSQRQSRLNKKL